MNKRYEVFVSYRRAGAASLAQLVHEFLQRRGLRVFLDVRSLGSGPFDRALLDRIGEARDFVVLLTPGALDNCTSMGDWLRREIAEALSTNRNILPLADAKFAFPPTLPPDVARLATYQCIPYDHHFSDASLDRLFEKTESSRRVRTRRWILTGAGIATLGGVVYILRRSVGISRGSAAGGSEADRLKPEVSAPSTVPDVEVGGLALKGMDDSDGVRRATYVVIVKIMNMGSRDLLADRLVVSFARPNDRIGLLYITQWGTDPEGEAGAFETFLTSRHLNDQWGLRSAIADLSARPSDRPIVVHPDSGVGIRLVVPPLHLRSFYSEDMPSAPVITVGVEARGKRLKTARAVLPRLELIAREENREQIATMGSGLENLQFSDVRDASLPTLY